MEIFKKKTNMKIFILTTLFLIIFLASCSKNNLPVTENQTEIPTASATLSPITASPTIPEVGKMIQLSMVSMKLGFALTEDNHVMKTIDGGLTWTEFYTIKAADIRTGINPYIYSIDANTLYIMARYDGANNFLSTTDGGKTWTTTVINSEISWVNDDTGGYRMNFINSNNGFILIESTPGAGQMLKTLYKTTDAGKSWVMITGDKTDQDNIKDIVPVGIGGYPSGMVFSTLQKGWMICSCYANYGIWMYRTDDGGETWNMVSLPEIPQEYSKWDKSNLFLSATQPSFYGSDNKNGKMIILFTTYEPEAKETEYIYSLSDEDTWQLEGKSNTIISNDKFIDDNNGIGLDTSGSICITEDGGLTWKQVDKQSEEVSPSPTVFPTKITSVNSYFNTDLIQWLKDTTNIPVYLPNQWNPVKREQNTQNYYFEASGDSISYGINVYTTNVSVKLNDYQKLLDENGPVSESDFVGSFSGAKYNSNYFAFEIPKDAERFDIVPRIKAYKKDDGDSVWWTEKGWNFNFVGTSNEKTLESLALAWNNSDIRVSKTGRVLIVAGNRLTFYYTWKKDGFQYSFTTHSTDYEDTVKILNSFINVDININD